MISDKELQNKVEKIQNKLRVELFDEVIFESNILLKKRKHEVLFNLISLAYQGKGDYENSIKIMEEALKISPSNIYFLNNLAISHHKKGNLSDAEKYFLKALKVKPDYINVLNNFGNLKKDLDQVEEAIKLYEKSVKIKSDILITNYNLASMYLGVGKYNEALKYFKNTLKINPNFTTADRNISLITKYTSDNEHFKKMLEKFNNLNLNEIEKIELNFALGKAYEDTKDFEKSFFHIKNANDLKKKLIKYDIKKDISLFKKIKDQFKSASKSKVSYNKKGIIFVLGLPRSGSTLVEQIISSHKKIHGACELTFLSDLLLKKFSDSEVKVDNLEELQKEYLEKVSFIDQSEKFITDKAPLNFRWIGLINQIFPNSKIIHCKRDPIDNCWSIYKNNFEAGLNFSCDLNDLGIFYNLYSDLMDFWEKECPGKIYNLIYENLTSNQETEIKNLLKFCELEWDPNCLKHHLNNKPIKTVSAVQARQPIYKSSIKKSEKYSDYLLDLKKILKI